MKVEYDWKKNECIVKIDRDELIRAFTSVGRYNDLIANMSKQIYELGAKL